MPAVVTSYGAANHPPTAIESPPQAIPLHSLFSCLIRSDALSFFFEILNLVGFDLQIPIAPATLFVETCRYLGLASRFISGYAHAPATEHWSATTHAWAEVYLPGAGWKGFDPTNGEAAGRRHIPVAVSRHPEAVPPVAGSFIGPSGSPPKLIVDVHIIALSES